MSFPRRDIPDIRRACRTLHTWTYFAFAGLAMCGGGCAASMSLGGPAALAELGADEEAPAKPSALSKPSVTNPPALNAPAESTGNDVAATGGASAKKPNLLGGLAALSNIHVLSPVGESSGSEPRRHVTPKLVRPASHASEHVDEDDETPPAFTATRGQSVRRVAAAEEITPRDAGPMEPVFDEQSAETMTIDQIVQTTIAGHPLLRMRRGEIEVAQSKLLAASIFPNPQLVLDTETPTQQGSPTEWSGRFTFTVPLGPRMNLSKQVADLGIQQASIALSRETEAQVEASITAAMELLYLQELDALQKELLALAEQGAKAVQDEVAAGRADRSAGVVSSVNAADLNLQRFKTETNLRAARLRLSRAMGLNPPRAIRIEGGLSNEIARLAPLETVLSAVRENRPEIAEAQIAIHKSRRELSLAAAEGIPDLELGPRWKDEFRSPGDTLGARFSLDVPLFDRNQGGIAESAANIHVNQASLGVVELTTMTDVAEAYAELLPLQARMDYYNKKVLALVSESEDTIRRAFEAGKIDSHKMADELQRLGKLRVEHLNLKFRYNQLRAKLELYAGKTLDQLAGEADAAAAAAARQGGAASGANPAIPRPAAPKPTPAKPEAKEASTTQTARRRAINKSGVNLTSAESTATPGLLAPKPTSKALPQALPYGQQ